MNTLNCPIATDAELEATLERIRHFQTQLMRLRQVETDPVAFRLSAGGFLAEIDTMQALVRSYLSSPSDKFAASA